MNKDNEFVLALWSGSIGSEKKIVQIEHCKGSVFLLTKDHEMYGYGTNQFSELGLNSTSKVEEVRLLSGFKNACNVACGANHVIVSDLDGNIFACGSNQYGQCGFDYQEPIIQQPREISLSFASLLAPSPTLSPKSPSPFLSYPVFSAASSTSSGSSSSSHQVTKFKCGNDHSVFLLENGTVQVCGSNQYGQLGIGKSQKVATQLTPLQFDSSSTLILDFDCCAHATVFITRQYEVYICGSLVDTTAPFATSGGDLLGTSFTASYDVKYGPFFTPTKIDFNFGVAKPLKCFAGPNHFFVVTDKVELFGFGNNSHNQLCTEVHKQPVCLPPSSPLDCSPVQPVNIGKLEMTPASSPSPEAKTTISTPSPPIPPPVHATAPSPTVAKPPAKAAPAKRKLSLKPLSTFSSLLGQTHSSAPSHPSLTNLELPLTVLQSTATEAPIFSLNNSTLQHSASTTATPTDAKPLLAVKPNTKLHTQNSSVLTTDTFPTRFVKVKLFPSQKLSLTHHIDSVYCSDDTTFISLQQIPFEKIFRYKKSPTGTKVILSQTHEGTLVLCEERATRREAAALELKLRTTSLKTLQNSIYKLWEVVNKSKETTNDHLVEYYGLFLQESRQQPKQTSSLLVPGHQTSTDEEDENVRSSISLDDEDEKSEEEHGKLTHYIEMKCFIAQEYLRDGTLKKFIEERSIPVPPMDEPRYLSEAELVRFAIQLAKAIQSLHTSGYVHTFIKQENIFMLKGGDAAFGTVFKLGGFLNLTNRIESSFYLQGSAVTVAPEVVERKIYDQSADIFSFGCVLLQLLTFQTRVMYSLVTQNEKGIKDQIQKTLPKKGYSKELVQLVKDCLRLDPKKRPNIYVCNSILRELYQKHQAEIQLIDDGDRNAWKVSCMMQLNQQLQEQIAALQAELQHERSLRKELEAKLSTTQ